MLNIRIGPGLVRGELNSHNCLFVELAINRMFSAQGAAKMKPGELTGSLSQERLPGEMSSQLACRWKALGIREKLVGYEQDISCRGLRGEERGWSLQLAESWTLGTVPEEVCLGICREAETCQVT